MKDPHTELFIRFLNNECSPEELEQVHHLLQQPDYIALLDGLIANQASAEWEHTGKADERLQPTVDRWKYLLNERIAAGNLQPLRSRRWLSIAAAITGLLVVSGLAFWALKSRNPAPVFVEHRNTGGAPAKYVLPDSSAIHLAAGSQIRYLAGFSGNKREIFLDGEAFFDVKQDPQKPFIIQTGEVHTEVLGTAFRISAFKGALLEVAVASGKVQVTDHRKHKELAVLTKGRKVSYDAVNGAVELMATDPSSLEKWAAGEVELDHQRLDQITQILGRIYNAEFRFAQASLAESRVSASFSTSEPLANVMEMLAFVGKFRFQYDHNKQLFILSEKK